MSRRRQDRCLVCDAVAIGINFGVSTCMPCKAFFRRNAVKLGVRPYVCQSDGHCSITYTDRRLCPCCRLAKCFRVGMKKSLILSDEIREARNRLIKANRLKRGKVTKQQCDNRKQPLTLLRMTRTSVQDLSPSDQVVLSNIFHAYENTCIAAKKAQFSIFPVVQHTSLHEFLHEISPLLPIFIEYFTHIPEFSSICIDDKLRLVKNHFGIMIHINEPLMHPITSSNLIVTWTNVFGDDITARLLKRNKIITQYSIEPILLKLVLIILVLNSSNGRNLDNTDSDQICDDTLSIFAAQNIYVELLWRYILSRSSTEENAVQFLNKLMMFILYTQKLHLHLDGYISSLRDEVEQIEPLMQKMWPTSDDEEIVIVSNINRNMT